MTEQGQPYSDSPSPLVKAYIDGRVEDAIKQHAQTQDKGKKWRNSWRSASPITKGTFIMTTAIAVATIAYAFVAWGQLCAMQKIASDNSAQTQQLIGAATQMKDAGWTFSGAAQGINNAEWDAVGRLQDQANQVKRSANAAQQAANAAIKQANTAAEQLELSRRPWLSITPTMETGLFENVSGLNMKLTVTSRNTGTTPAVHSVVYAKFFPITLNASQTQQIKQFACNSAISISNTSEEIVVPGGTSDELVQIRMSPEFLKQNTQFGFLNVQIVFCTAYRGDFGDSPQYSSPQIFDLYRHGPLGGRLAIEPSKDTPLGELRLASRTSEVTFAD